MDILPIISFCFKRQEENKENKDNKEGLVEEKNRVAENKKRRRIKDTIKTLSPEIL